MRASARDCPLRFFGERKVTSDFFLAPRVTYNNVKIYGEHIFDDYDTIKTRNGKKLFSGNLQILWL